MVFAMMLASLTSCDAKSPDEIKVRSKDVSSEETESTTVTETTETSFETEPTETTPTPTEVPQEDYGFVPEYFIANSTTFDGEKEQSVRTANIYLSDATIAEYPNLASCIDSFNESNTEDMLFEILDALPDADGVVNCFQKITVARADSQIFSFSVHYLAYAGNPNDGVLFDYIEAYSYDVASGYEYTFEDIFNMEMTEEEYVESRTGITGSADIDYLIGYNGVTVIAEKAGGYDPNDPVSTLTFTNYCIYGGEKDFKDPDMFSVEDCVIRNLGWDMDFISNINEETILDTYFEDPYTGKGLNVTISFSPIDNQAPAKIEMTVTDMDTHVKIAQTEFAGNIYSTEAFLFCREGNYSLALQVSGYDDDVEVTFLPFTGNEQISDPVTVKGSLMGYATDFSIDFYPSDTGLVITECNSAHFICFSKRIDLLGTYFYVDSYLLNEEMIPEDLEDIQRAVTFFGYPLVTAIDFDFRTLESDEKVTVPAGTELYIYGVIAGERTVILVNGDEYYSLKYDDLDDSLQNKVDGIADTEIFEDVYYSYGL